MVIRVVRFNTGDSMRGIDDSSAEEYGEAEIDDRGRLTIPKDLREDLQIAGETTVTVVREGSDIRLVRQLPELRTLSSGKSRDEWDEETFRDAGETTFSER